MELSSIQNYLLRDLGIAVKLAPIEIPDAPFFVRKKFESFQFTLEEKCFCMLVSKNRNLALHSFQEIMSAAAFVRNKAALFPVFVFAAMSKQERLELVKRKLAFLVPDIQMYIPYLGIDFFERVPQILPEERTALRPASQAMIIQQILTGELDGLTVNQASKRMEYTAMGTLRAANQLNEIGICRTDFDGYHKTLHFPAESKTLWETAKKYLRNPVRKTYSVEDDSALTSFPFAGEFALGRHSDLSVTRKTYALQQKDFSALLKNDKIKIAFCRETGTADIQIWCYSLPLWHDEIDPISLALSLQDSMDARIKIALMNLKEQHKW